MLLHEFPIEDYLNVIGVGISMCRLDRTVVNLEVKQANERVFVTNFLRLATMGAYPVFVFFVVSRNAKADDVLVIVKTQLCNFTHKKTNAEQQDLLPSNACYFHAHGWGGGAAATTIGVTVGTNIKNTASINLSTLGYHLHLKGTAFEIKPLIQAPVFASNVMYLHCGQNGNEHSYGPRTRQHIDDKGFYHD